MIVKNQPSVTATYSLLIWADVDAVSGRRLHETRELNVNEGRGCPT